jgi:cobyrinic acid a,c-diamide synthase
MSPPGLLIAAPRSGSGKTTVALGLMRALVRRGLRVRGAKCGPDYIDPAFHVSATGRPSVNLDSWAMPPELMAGLVADIGKDCDLVVAEALMGLFDGVEDAATGRSGSSADVAAVTGWPVILVLDVSGQSQSAGAVAVGFAKFDPRIRIAGVVLNKVGSERHARLAAAGIEAGGLCILGALPRTGVPALPERHLGLVQAEETANLDRQLDALADGIAAHIDLDRIVALAAARPATAAAAAIRLRPPGQRVALARDVAFSFVYSHVLAGWRAAGAEIAMFSPLADEPPPDHCDCAWLPGGYPELHAGRIAAASRFQNGLRRFAESRRVHGECGGYMVLGTSLEDAQGTGHPMVGLLGLSTSFTERSLHLGYREAVLDADGPLGPAGARIRGHEFHYAKMVSTGGDAPFADVTDSAGRPIGDRGTRRGNVSGTFFHAMASVT